MNTSKHTNNANSYNSDAFSSVLRLLKLNVQLYFNAAMCGNWKINEHTLGSTCFHLVTIGRCKLDVPGYINSEILNSGDLVIFPRELSHTLLPVSETFDEQRLVNYSERIADDDGTGLLCGEMRFKHHGSRYILDALPPVLIIRNDNENPWVKSLLNLILDESYNFGAASSVLLDTFSELLFTYALKNYLNNHPKKIGILAIYGHPRLARAVNAIHQHPNYDWTLASMAKEAALSRTAFSDSFKKVSGMTAGKYLAWWRMQLAWSLLQNGKDITSTASEVGYLSESAFSHIFHKTFSISPGKVRKLGL